LYQLIPVAMAARILSLPGVTLGAAIEALLVTKSYPQHLPEHNPFIYAFLRFLVLNYALLAGYWGLIYPFFISPLRHFPSPKVRLRQILDVLLRR
jgi:hypothetical protein